ncbi:DUF1360 domain-containing protein [Bacillus sp. BRMEA1]|nr:DUF1360 domain-containing protein [Neobacillus endophyticus]
MKLTILNFFILSLACFRLTRLIVFDKITEFIRAPFYDEVREVNPDGEEEVYYIPKQTGIKHFFGELLSCYWCTGIWMASAIVIVYYLFPAFSAPVIVILAVAGFGAIIEAIVQHFIEK